MNKVGGLTPEKLPPNDVEEDDSNVEKIKTNGV